MISTGVSECKTYIWEEAKSQLMAIISKRVDLSVSRQLGLQISATGAGVPQNMLRFWLFFSSNLGL